MLFKEGIKIPAKSKHCSSVQGRFPLLMKTVRWDWQLSKKLVSGPSNEIISSQVESLQWFLSYLAAQEALWSFLGYEMSRCWDQQLSFFLNWFDSDSQGSNYIVFLIWLDSIWNPVQGNVHNNSNLAWKWNRFLENLFCK